MRRSLHLVGALMLSTGVLEAQGTVRSRVRTDDRPTTSVYSYGVGRYDDPDRAAIGVTTSSGGMRDTLGLLVQSVTAGGPADKAGIEEGNRLVSINGVNLRLSAADAGEGDMEGIASRRLIRELGKVKAGDEVELRVWAGGQTKSVKVKTVAVEDLPSRARIARREMDDRPVLGLSLSATGSRRDTLGMLVVRVTTDGPAEKAGIVEGDRVAAINGVSLRVASEDAGDSYMSSARMNRYRRELGKVTLGEDVELGLYSGGQTKTLRIKPVRAGDLPRDRGGLMIIGDGAVGFGDWTFPAMPSVAVPPVAPMAPRPPRVFQFDGGLENGIRMRLDPEARFEIEQRATEAARRAQQATREILERLNRIRFDAGRRADDAAEGAAEASAAAEAAAAAAVRGARAGSRISSTEAPEAAGAGYGYGYGVGTGGGVRAGQTIASGIGASTSTAPAARFVLMGGNTVAATAPAAAFHSGTTVGTGRVAVWTGDDATFMLQGLRLARVNDDLAAYLGRGSEEGFLVLDAGARWSGLRSGDVLIGVDGQPVRDGASARIALGDGDEHAAEVIRDGRRRVVSVDVR